MGSRRTHDDRLARLDEAGLDEAGLDEAGLDEAGLDEAALARLSSPIGLDLGARTPEETAVPIAAEIRVELGRFRAPADQPGRTGHPPLSAPVPQGK